MARPRVFVSSTFYDLKHLRSSLENFVDSLGFDSILSEKGRIAYSPDLPLDESCYREAESADIFVLIIGGRYGSESSRSRKALHQNFYERYSSITRGEYESAVKRDVPTYILIERNVYAEYETYTRNKENASITYAHVDSVNVFTLIEDVLRQPSNNPVQQFDRYSEIEVWLKEQWAGLFRELMKRSQGQKQIASLQQEVGHLSEINTTLKHYLEELVNRIAPEQSKQLINEETERLREATADRLLKTNSLAAYLLRNTELTPAQVRMSVQQNESLDTFLSDLLERDETRASRSKVERLKANHLNRRIRQDFTDLRFLLGLKTPTLDLAPPSDE